VLAGLGTGLSLIVVIGAQNAFVLRQGLRREHVFWVVVACAASDMILMALGTGGLEQVSRLAYWLLPVLRWAGVGFLIVYGVLTLRRAFKSESMSATGEGRPVSLGRCLATCLALTYLNPHVYIDTVLLIGSVANSHRPLQWSFAAGAMAGSWIWFTALGFGARWLRPVFASPVAWRVLDIVITAIMWTLAVSLILG